jgi:methionyl-tRNA formyltransferase
MRILFMGSAPLACGALEALLAAGQDTVVGMVSQPDRPKGRRLEISECPAKTYAGARSIPMFTPEKVNAPESVEHLRGLKPDLIVVVAYGQILRPALLTLAPHGCVNVHASLLPKYRGAAPIAWAIARGEEKTGVTTMFLNERMDAGDLIDQEEVAIEPTDTAGILQERLAVIGGRLLVKTIASIAAGTAVRKPQDVSRVTWAPKLTKADGRIDWNLTAREICNRIRAFDPWPGGYCELPADSGNFVKIERAEPVDLGDEAIPGLICAGRSGLVIQAGKGGVLCRMVRPQGGKSMDGAAFLRGHPANEGDRAG